MLPDRSRVRTVGVRCLEALHAILRGDAQIAPHHHPDLLLVGSEPLADGLLGKELRGVRQRSGRPVPYVLIPEDRLPPGGLNVPYITYGESPRAHLRLVWREGECWAETPLGCAPLPLRWNALDCLAAIGCALVLRIGLNTALERLASAVLMPLSAA